jgi:hypothetical protein
VQRQHRLVWYAKYRIGTGRQIQKKLGPAWTRRSRPSAGHFTPAWPNVGCGQPSSTVMGSKVHGFRREDVRLQPLYKGSRVAAGTILGRIGKVSTKATPHLRVEIRPAGRGAPRIDPKPILDGWKLLESTSIYRAQGKNPFFGPDARTPSIGQILLMSKQTWFSGCWRTGASTSTRAAAATSAPGSSTAACLRRWSCWLPAG